MGTTKPRGKAKSQVSTRQRILDATLRLLNERGTAAITTAEIAATVGIREGNLHYYFPRKETIVVELFETFAIDVVTVSSGKIENPSKPDGYFHYQLGWFRLMWRYRCFYRDQWALQGIAPDLGPRFGVVQDEAQRHFKGYVAQLVANGFMRATPKQIDRLVINTWIVSSYWMDFHRCQNAGRNSSKAAIGKAELIWGFSQILALFEPYLTEAGQALPAIEAGQHILALLDA